MSDEKTFKPARPGRAWDKGSDFRVGDVFFWRDTPDWYHKTFETAGVGLAFCSLRVYMNRKNTEVFMPPRSKVLPASLKQGYMNSQVLKYGFLKAGHEASVVAGAAAIFYGGAFYLGEYRGRHSWENFAASGALASVCAGAFVLRPLPIRVAILGTISGAMLGTAVAKMTEAAGLPYWRPGHDWKGWFFGSFVNCLQDEADAAEAAELARRTQPAALG